MTELSQGRSVKWKSKGAWHTGYVLRCGRYEVRDMCLPGKRLVKDSCTSRIFVVKASMLKANDFRKKEKQSEVNDGSEKIR